MKPYRIVQENPDHFVVHIQGEKKPIKIAIDRRHHSTVQKIRKYAQGGEVTPADDNAAAAEWFNDRSSKGSFGPFSVSPEDAAGILGVPPLPTEAPRKPGTPIPVSLPPELMAMRAAPRPEGAPLEADLRAPAGGPGDLQAHPIDTSTPMRDPAQPDPGTQIQGLAEQQATALQEKGNVEGAGLAEQAKIQEAAAARLQENTAQGQQMLAQRMQHQDELFNAVASEKYEPNRWWGTRSTGQKISAAIGLILGGIGAGLTKGPNYALEIIQNAIARDMEAQRLNIGKQQNLLSHYMQQTRDLQSAQHYARADYLTSVAAQLAASQAKTGSGMAAPSAAAAIAQLRQHATMESQAAVSRGLSIREQQINLALSQQTSQALGIVLKGVSGGGGFNARILETPGLEKFRERSVMLPDGTIAFAPDKEEANKANESMASVSRLKSKLQRYSDLLENGSPSTLDRGTAQAQHADLLSEIGHLHDLNRLSDKDLELFRDQVPDIAGLTTFKPFSRQKLKGLGQSIDDKTWSINKQILRLGGTRPGGQ